MKKWNLALAIMYSMSSVWYNYRLLSNLSQLAKQARWLSVLDVICAIAPIGLAIYYWIRFAKDKKKEKESE